MKFQISTIFIKTTESILGLPTPKYKCLTSSYIKSNLIVLSTFVNKFSLYISLFWISRHNLTESNIILKRIEVDFVDTLKEAILLKY